MNALITGGTGFIGSHLAESLHRQGWKLRIIAKDKMFGDDLGADVVYADLRDCDALADALRDVDVVFHLAGLTRARKNSDYYLANHLMTRDLIDACIRHGSHINRFVYVSSLTAVGPRRGDETITEATDYHPVSHYGRSKMLAEIEVMNAAAQLPVTIVRPSAVYGPRDRDLFRYFKMIRSGVELLLGSGAQLLNLVHVGDLVRGIELAALHPDGVNETFFIGSETDYRTDEICSSIAIAMDRTPLVLHLPVGVLYLTGLLGECAGRIARREVFFNVQKVREAVQRAWSCSIAKAQDRLGFEPRLSLGNGMNGTYDWYLKHGWL
jgi:dihydroflavonol-4-reductase